jgi:hypothetical protein
MKRIRLHVGGLDLPGRLDDSPLADELWRLLPLDCFGETWGEEVYFPVNLAAGNSRPVEEVAVGDIAYWPDGPDLCVFFGRTPKSTGAVPVVASPVTVVGGFDPAVAAEFPLIRRDRRGIPVRIERDDGTPAASAPPPDPDTMGQ